MNNEDQPEFPTIHASTDECEITDSHQQAQWFERMMIHVDAAGKSLGWKYEMGDIVLSTSSKFRFICRAKVSWVNEDGVYQTVEALWENKVGQTGSMSAFIEELPAKQPGRYGMTGTGVHLLDGDSAEWLINPKDVDNDS
jgi:hypothetical protein